jgi:predicted polyphosphate/ATP-dependent NAD kinase
MPGIRSAILVYNPFAGRFSVKPFIKYAVQELESAGWQVDAAETKSGEHTVELARQAAAENKDAVFAVGGDGTIGNVVNGLVGSETALGVLPSGASSWAYSPLPGPAHGCCAATPPSWQMRPVTGWMWVCATGSRS